jgi:hypothetical protein
MSLTRSDRDHLHILVICHYVLAGLCFFFGCFMGIYIAIGIAVVLEGPGAAPPNGPPPEIFGWFFVGVGALCLLFYWGLAAGLVLAGRYMSQRRRRTFCMVAAGFSCLFQPLGLVLGVFTFLVLLRPSVREAFEPYREEGPEEEVPEYDRYHSE